MTTTGDEVHVAINRSDSAKTVGGLPGGALTDVVDGSTQNGPSVSVPARTTRILVSP